MTTTLPAGSSATPYARSSRARPELARPEPRPRRRVLHEHEVLVAHVRLAVDGAAGRERLVDVPGRVDGDAAGTLLLGGARQRRLHGRRGRLVEELEDELGALDEGRAPDVPVVAAVDDAKLGGQVRDADGLVEEHVRLEVEIVRRVLRIGVLELVVADGDEHRQLLAARLEGLERGRVVQLPVDRVDEEALAEPVGAELPRRGVARRIRHVHRRAEHDRGAEEIGMRERVAERAGAAHRIAGHAAAAAVGDRSVGAVDVREQILRERRLDRAARVGARVARVDVVARPAAPRRVGHDRDRRLDLARGDQLVEGALHLRPRRLRVAAAVEEVEDRVAVGRAGVARREIHVVGDRLVQRGRMEAPLGQASLRDGGAGADGRRSEQDEQQCYAAGERRCDPGPHVFLPWVEMPYESASATVCRAAPSMAASTNSPPSSVPTPAPSRRATVSRARSTSSAVGR